MKQSSLYEIQFPVSCFECDLKISVKYTDYLEAGGIRGVPVEELKKKAVILD